SQASAILAPDTSSTTLRASRPASRGGVSWLSTIPNIRRPSCRPPRRSLIYDSPEADALRAAARRNRITVVMGLSERKGHSLYISQWIIGPDGETLLQRQKLKPTHLERTVFGDGEGSGLTVIDSPLGKLGGLCCAEHVQPLTKAA
ncbi:carbon-nitrogen family hydrolase, partial [Medicago truncatula]